MGKYDKIQEKMDKGEDLSKEEIKDVMSAPPGELDSYKGKIEDEEEDINWDEAEDEEEENEEEKEEKPKKEKKPSEAKKKDEKTPEEEEGDEKPKKKAETPKAKKKDEKTPKDKGEEEDNEKIETELAKPEGQEDLSKLSKREKGLFWSMRRERRARQNAEKERDELRFQQLKEKAAKEKDAETKKEEEEEDILPDLDDDDFPTKAEIKKALKGKKKDETPQTQPQGEGQLFRQAYLKMCDQVAQKQYDDYEEVIECAPEIVAKNQAHQKEIIEAIESGQNPAVKMYNIIKSDPQFDKTLSIARARLKAQGKQKAPEKKEDTEAKKAEEKIEENEKKPKTSGHYGGEEAASKGKVSIEQITNMSDQEFARMPKTKRDKLLKKFGV